VAIENDDERKTSFREGRYPRRAYLVCEVLCRALPFMMTEDGWWPLGDGAGFA
jgi:hypothetical protein